MTVLAAVVLQTVFATGAVLIYTFVWVWAWFNTSFPVGVVVVWVDTFINAVLCVLRVWEVPLGTLIHTLPLFLIVELTTTSLLTGHGFLNGPQRICTTTTARMIDN